MSGWYAMKRGWMEHEIFDSEQPYTKREAWVWIVENACFKPTPVDIGGRPHTVPRGSLCYSLRFLARKWRWSVKSVQTFLCLLESHGVVRVSVVDTGAGAKTKRTQISLCNYDKYQQVGDKRETAEKQKGDKEEQGNNIPVGEAADAASETVIDLSSPNAAVWAIGKAFLAKHGKKNPGSTIGMWLKAATATEIIGAIEAAEKAGTQDPVPYITAILKPKHPWRTDAQGRPEIGSTRITRDGRQQVYVNHYDGWMNENSA